MTLIFSHKGLRSLYFDGKHSGISPSHSAKINRILAKLSVAVKPSDMNVPGWSLHPLRDDLLGYWSVRIETNWRIIFKFDGDDIVNIDYRDYH